MRATRPLQKKLTWISKSPSRETQARKLLRVLDDSLKPHLPAWQPITGISKGPPNIQVEKTRTDTVCTHESPSVQAQALSHIDSILDSPSFKGLSTHPRRTVREAQSLTKDFYWLAHEDVAEVSHAQHYISSLDKILEDEYAGKPRWHKMLAWKDVGLASHVAEWIFRRPEEFQKLDMAPELLVKLVKGLVAESKTHMLVTWIFEPTPQLQLEKSIKISQLKAHALDFMISYELWWQKRDLKTVAILFGHMLRQFDEAHHGEEPAEVQALKSSLFTVCGVHLTFWLARENKVIPPHRYDRWIEEIPTWSTRPEILRMIAVFYHPTGSRTMEAYNLLLEASSQHKLLGFDAKEGRRFAWFCADLAERLLEDGCYTETRRVLAISKAGTDLSSNHVRWATDHRNGLDTPATDGSWLRQEMAAG